MKQKIIKIVGIIVLFASFIFILIGCTLIYNGISDSINILIVLGTVVILINLVPATSLIVSHFNRRNNQ